MIKQYLPFWEENAWCIQLKGKNGFGDQGWLTEDDILKKFNCTKHLRKEKLNKIYEHSNR